MIRFVHIGNQINEGENEFCFFDTINMKCIEFCGEQVFDSLEDFKFFSEHDLYNRCERLIPQWYRNTVTRINTLRIEENT